MRDVTTPAVSVDNLRKIVGRNVRRHTDRDTVRAVDKQVGISCRKNDGFFFATVEVGDKIDRFLIQVFEHFRGELGESCFRVTHSRGGVAVD